MDKALIPWVGAVVVTHDNKRMGWKVSRGAPPDAMSRQLNMRYFGRFAPEDCVVYESRFDGEDCFDRAAEWARSFERHPEARGFEP